MATDAPAAGMVGRVGKVARAGGAAGMAGQDGAGAGMVRDGGAAITAGAGPIGDGARGLITIRAPIMAATLLPHVLRGAAVSQRQHLSTVL